MVLDNETNLIWEVKQNKDSVQDYGNPNDADNTYTWDESSQNFIFSCKTPSFGRGQSQLALPVSF